MHILSIHNNYQIRGGEDESREVEENLLRAHGHEVSVYEEHNDRITDLTPWELSSRTIWSQESYGIVTKMLRDRPIDLIHVQNFFPLISPSVYYAAQAAGVPVVQTLRNYRLICPNGLFFRDGAVCEQCLGKAIPYPALWHKCYRQNRGATAITAAMLTIHRLLETWQTQVNRFITLSEFARQKFLAAGFPPEKIVVKPNFVEPLPAVGSGQGGYGLYVGRLSVEKGLDILLEAWQSLPQPFPLKIIGDGPLSPMVEAACAQNPQIQWLGRQPLDRVYDLLGEAYFSVFPSKWYETFGRVGVEAFAKGTPVIAADIGAIAELIDHGRTGLKFQASNPQSLAQQVQWALDHPQALATMRHHARSQVEAKYTAAANYQQLLKIYEEVLAQG